MTFGEKIPTSTRDLSADRMEKLAELFPDCMTESIIGGIVKQCIDLEKLKKVLGENTADESKDRYSFTWPDKKKAIAIANAPTNSVLRPVREESVDFDNTKNVYIEGDNLEALKCLREAYLGSVRVIFIDPPYNTGNDFIYKDNFAQSITEEKLRAGLVDEQGRKLAESYEVNTITNGRFHTD